MCKDRPQFLVGKHRKILFFYAHENDHTVQLISPHSQAVHTKTINVMVYVATRTIGSYHRYYIARFFLNILQEVVVKNQLAAV